MSIYQYPSHNISHMKVLITYFVVAVCLNSDVVLGACDKNKSASTPTSQFILREGEAFDQKTKLTWCRCSVGTTWKKGAGCVGAVKLMSLEDAKQIAQKLGGGWRIPTIEELYSIVEQRCTNPAINSEVFPDVKNSGEGAPYWSVTKIKEMPSLIYYIDFLSSEADGHTKGFPMAVRLVRTGR
ncbi:MAG: DUF1566 domain-containing protein [Deltaproteobacteria bacterium]|nr:DUF1566 domain-containing protein [Deltaproteobacteria bacterium]